MSNKKPLEKPRMGFLQDQASVPDDFNTLSQHEIEAAFSGGNTNTNPVPAAAEDGLAKKLEPGGENCQVCDFPAVAGKVEGDLNGEWHSLRVCQGCLQHAVLCLRDSYRQCRLFDDDFELEELCNFGKRKKPSLSELLEQSDAASSESERSNDWEQMKPAGKEYGAEEDSRAIEIKLLINSLLDLGLLRSVQAELVERINSLISDDAIPR